MISYLEPSTNGLATPLNVVMSSVISSLLREFVTLPASDK